MANEDLLKDISVSYEDGNYFVVTVTDLQPNQSYPIQFKWTYKDKTSNTTWSPAKIIVTPAESEPNTPNFTSGNIDVTSPEKIIITWDGKSDDSSTMINYDRIDVYIDGAPFDGSKAAYSFNSPGTTTIAAPAGTYQIVLYAISKSGVKSPVSSAVTKTVLAVGEIIQSPTLPSGLSVTTAPFSVSVNWPGTYSSSTFTGFKSIDIYAVGSDLGSSITSGISSTNLVASLTVQDTSNKTNIGLDNLRQALSLSTNSDVYSASIFYYYNSVNKNGTKYGSPTYTRINSSSVIPTKANFVDLVSGVISIENLVAGSGNFASWMRVGSSSGGSRIELSAVNDFTNSGYTVQKGMVAYSSGGTEIFNLDTDAGTLSINGSGTFTGNLSVGSSNAIFKAEPATGIWLGNATYASAPFSVSNNGVIKANSGTIGGWALGTTYFQNASSSPTIKIDTSGITVGTTTAPYLDISPSGIVHRNADGTASGKFSLTTGSSGSLTLSGSITVTGGTALTSSDLSGYATTSSLSSGLSGKVSSGGSLADIGSGGITSAYLATGSVIATKIAANAVTETTIAGGSITTGKIAALAITSELIQAGAIIADKIATNAITADKINANAITADKISANAITADKISANAITASKIAAGTITATEIDSAYVYAGYISADKINAGTITSSVSISTPNITVGSSTDSYYFKTNFIRTGTSVPALAVNAINMISQSSAGTVSSWYPYYNNDVALGVISPSTLRYTTTYLVNNPNVSSDFRLKEDIQESPLGLNFINDLRPIKFKWKERNKEGDPGVRDHYGFIAQEVKQTLDNHGVYDTAALWAVDRLEDEESHQALVYNEFVSPIVKAIQELSNKLNIVSQRLDALEG
jgi:hypothetical protein